MKTSKSLKEQIYEQIIDGIVSGEYKGGQILNEQELVQRYNVSKSPVREALTILSSEGILTSIPRYGYQVISFNLSNIRAIMEFRAVLEDYVLCKSFPALTPASIAHLEELALQTSESGDIWEHWTLNENFHLALSSLAENEYLYLQLKKAMHFLKLAYAQFYWSHWNNASLPNDLKNHSRILNCLKAGDLELARIALKDDLADFCME